MKTVTKKMSHGSWTERYLEVGDVVAKYRGFYNMAPQQLLTISHTTKTKAFSLEGEEFKTALSSGTEDMVRIFGKRERFDQRHYRYISAEGLKGIKDLMDHSDRKSRLQTVMQALISRVYKLTNDQVNAALELLEGLLTETSPKALSPGVPAGQDDNSLTGKLD